MGISRGSVKSILVGCAFLGLVAWNAVIQVNQQNHQNRFSDHEQKFSDHVRKISDHERKFVDNERKFSDNERKFGDNERKFVDNERKFGDNERKFVDNERKFRDNERKFVDNERKFSDHERKIRSIDESTSSRIKRAVNNKKTGGATYIRWGRTECPGDAELVYKGYAAGQWFQHTGGSAEYICLTDEPVFTQNSAGLNSGSWIDGVEIETGPPKWPLLEATNSKPSDLVNSNVKCAVCRTPTRSSKLMIPGTNKCGPGWTMEYWGYLMTGHYQHAAQHNYACLDKAPEAGSEGGSKDENGALMHHVQADCGHSLACQPYVHGYELTCVVCTK